MFRDWFPNLDQVRQDVLIDMAYNLGFFGLSTFKNTLAYIANGNYDKAADNMLKSKWATQVKGRAEELAEMMRTGVYKEQKTS